MIDKARLARIAAIELEDLPLLIANARDSSQNSNGLATHLMIAPVRRLAVAAYHLQTDPAVFRARLREAGQLQVELLRRFAAGEPIGESLASILSYHSIFDFLAASSFGEAQELARLMGKVGSGASTLAFDQAMGHALRHAVLDDPNATQVRVKDLEEACEETEYRPFHGYPSLLAGIVLRDRNRCERALRDVVAGHRKLVARGGFFANTPDMYMCIWGLGLANLARHRGIDVTLDDEFLPEQLLAED